MAELGYNRYGWGAWQAPEPEKQMSHAEMSRLSMPIGYEGYGIHDFTRFDFEIRAILDANPDAYVYPKVAVCPPLWWMEANEDELVRLEDGTLYSKAFGKKRHAYHAVSLGSEKWRKDFGDAFTKFLEHIQRQEYNDRIYGYQITGGYNEWAYVFAEIPLVPDFSPAALAAFRSWLRRKYDNDVAKLRAAWRDASVKRTFQTILYFPYFISWAVIGVMLIVLFSTSTGVFGGLSERLTGSRLSLLASRDYFRGVLVVSDVWRHVGWGSIIYLAAISQVDPQLYEAAFVDGAGRRRQAWHITIPSISSVIVLLLILRIGWIMRAGFEQILVLQNSIVRDVAEVFETYVYRVGIGRSKYSFAAAADFFKSVVSLLMVVAADRFAKWIGEEGLL